MTAAGTAAGGRPVIATIVLAAGGSSRMAGGHKLLEELGGRPVIASSVGAALDAGLGPVLVVTGDRSEAVARALPSEVALVENPGWASGMAGSLRLGTAALPDGIDGFAVALGDMPLVRAAHYRVLMRAWTAGAVVVPIHQGRRGHPVIWSRQFVSEMAELHGDGGARALVDRHTDVVVEVPIGDPGVLVDVDTRAQLAVARAMLSGEG